MRQIAACLVFDYEKGRRVVQFFSLQRKISIARLNYIRIIFNAKKLRKNAYSHRIRMRLNMKKLLYRTLVFGLAAVSGTFAVYGQDDKAALAAAAGDKYVISAEAGNVNFIDGKAEIKALDGRNALLLKGDRLKIGEEVSTQPNSKVEILLNPGSYVRLGGNAVFAFEDTDLDNLKLELRKGSAIFEVYADEDFPVMVKTPKNSFAFIDSGVYRVDVNDEGVGRLEVWKGKAAVGDADGETLKGGRTATITEGGATIAKFDRDDKDGLDQWSKDRSKELSKITSKLKKDLRGPLLSSFRGSGFGGWGWNVYDSYGLWIYDPMFGGHCFLPFGYGWSTPYGYYLNRGLWYYHMPWYIYNPPVQTTNPTNPRTPTRDSRIGGSPSAASDSGRNTRGARNNNVRTVPPFVKVGGARPINRGGYDMDASSPGRAPVYVPVRPAPSAPVPSRGARP